MKLITFQRDGDVAAGYIDGEDAVVCTSGPGAKWALLGLIAGGEAALQEWKAQGAERVPLKDVTLMAPIPEPRRDIFCVGKNYFRARRRVPLQRLRFQRQGADPVASCNFHQGDHQRLRAG